MTAPELPGPVQIPQNALASGDAGADIGDPTTRLLQRLNLLPSKPELDKADGFGAAFSGPPSSVSIIEAGATAAAKWWAGGLAVAVGGLWTAVAGFWTDLNSAPETQRVILWGVAIATSAALLALSYILGSDVRGRAAAMVATIDTRGRVADSMIRMAERAYAPAPPSSPEFQMVALPAPISAMSLIGQDSNGWQAIAVRTAGPTTEYLLAKDDQHSWLDSSQVKFVKGPRPIVMNLTSPEAELSSFNGG